MTQSADDIEAQTDAIAAKAQSMAADGVSIQQRSLQDQIAYEKHRAEQAAARGNSLGIKSFKIKPGGAL